MFWKVVTITALGWGTRIKKKWNGNGELLLVVCVSYQIKKSIENQLQEFECAMRAVERNESVHDIEVVSCRMEIWGRRASPSMKSVSLMQLSSSWLFDFIRQREGLLRDFHYTCNVVKWGVIDECMMIMHLVMWQLTTSVQLVPRATSVMLILRKMRGSQSCHKLNDRMALRADLMLPLCSTKLRVKVKMSLLSFLMTRMN